MDSSKIEEDVRSRIQPWECIRPQNTITTSHRLVTNTCRTHVRGIRCFEDEVVCRHVSDGAERALGAHLRREKREDGNDNSAPFFVGARGVLLMAALTVVVDVGVDGVGCGCCDGDVLFVVALLLLLLSS